MPNLTKAAFMIAYRRELAQDQRIKAGNHGDTMLEQICALAFETIHGVDVIPQKIDDEFGDFLVQQTWRAIGGEGPVTLHMLIDLPEGAPCKPSKVEFLAAVGRHAGDNPSLAARHVMMMLPIVLDTATELREDQRLDEECPSVIRRAFWEIGGEGLCTIRALRALPED